MILIRILGYQCTSAQSSGKEAVLRILCQRWLCRSNILRTGQVILIIFLFGRKQIFFAVSLDLYCHKRQKRCHGYVTHCGLIHYDLIKKKKKKGYVWYFWKCLRASVQTPVSSFIE